MEKETHENILSHFLKKERKKTLQELRMLSLSIEENVEIIGLKDTPSSLWSTYNKIVLKKAY